MAEAGLVLSLQVPGEERRSSFDIQVERLILGSKDLTSAGRFWSEWIIPLELPPMLSTSYSVAW